jgi:hypothetical protein
MPPKSCPLHLQRLITRENALPASDPHPLRQVLKAFQDRRRNKGSDTFAVQSLSEVTINLTDYTVTVRSELALALAEIDSPEMVDLIRECPTCKRLFWAGRADRMACDAHVGQWRQSEYRRNKKRTQAENQRERSEAQRRTMISKLSHTEVAVINAIMAHGMRVHWEIDDRACYELRWLRERGKIRMERIPNNYIVRLILARLVRDEYLTHQPDVDPTEDRYEPEDELLGLWKDISRFRTT